MEVTFLQPSYGDIPTDFGEDYNKCLMVKLAQDHVAIDFLIVNCRSVGVCAQKLYFACAGFSTEGRGL